MSDCIFCKIIRKEIAAQILFEDEIVVVLLDNRPTNIGHILIMPRQHYADFLQTSDEVIEKLFVTAKKAAQAATTAVSASAFNMITNNGSVAGQVIMHTHIHIIPRFADDGLKHWPAREFEASIMDETTRKIKALLAK